MESFEDNSQEFIFDPEGNGYSWNLMNRLLPGSECPWQGCSMARDPGMLQPVKRRRDNRQLLNSMRRGKRSIFMSLISTVCSPVC